MSKLPDTSIKRDGNFVIVKIPAQVVAGMTQEYWDMISMNARRLVGDVTPVHNLHGMVAT